MAEKSKRKRPETVQAGEPAAPKLLSGGNPQIPKGYGDAPVKAWIAALPGWKSDAARRLDALVERSVPDVRKAVKWNSPFYGIGEDDHWFLGVHAFAKYLKIAFFRGTELEPMPPVASKSAGTRYVHLTEDEFDEARLVDWIVAASRLPGVKM